MKHVYFLISLLFFFQISANEIEKFSFEPDPLAESYNSLEILSGEPRTMIHQCVNVITGEYIDMSTDLIVPGAEHLALSRFYSSQDQYCWEPLKAWKFNHDKAVYKLFPTPKSDIIIRDAFGAMLPFQMKQSKHKKTVYQVHPEIFKKRVTNTSKHISGRHHLNNKTLTLNPHHVTAMDGAGNLYYYKSLASKQRATLTKVLKPNGNKIQYEYEDDKFKSLKTITAFNKVNKYYGQINFTQRQVNKDIINLEVISTGNFSVSYELRAVPYKENTKWILNRAKPFDAPEESYDYDPNFDRIISKKLPDHRSLHIDYYKTGHNAVWHNQDYPVKGVRTGRVMRLSAPVGKDANLIPIYRFLYFLDAFKEKGGPLDIRGGRTDVFDAYNHKSSYHFGADERLSKIENFKGAKDYSLYSCELFFWGEANTPKAGNLKCKALTSADGAGIYCCRYKYDDHGNVLEERLYGNLSGKFQKPLAIDELGKPQKGCECLKIERQYSQDGRNLILFENHQTQPHDCRYEYYLFTDLLKAKYILDGPVVCMREFFEYDDNGAKTVEIVDDGSSFDRGNLTDVTEQRIRRISNRQSFPMGLPDTIEEKYLDLSTGKECLLKRIVNKYNTNGKLSQQTIYDSKNNLQYTLTWNYNKLGKVIEETNALGQTITRRFDANGNKFIEQGFNKNVYSRYTYDYMNRLMTEEEVWTDGTVLSKKYDYDFLGNRISATDIYGQKTEYAYDAFSRLIKTTYPTADG